MNHDEVMNSIDMIVDVTLESEIMVIQSLCDYYTKQCVFIENAHYQESITQFFQEGEKWDAFKNDVKSARGNEEESLIKRILLFIPRILKACIVAIGRFFKKSNTDEMIKELKDLKQRVEDLEKDNSKNKENVKVLAKHIVALHSQIQSEQDLNDSRYDSLRNNIASVYNEMQKMGAAKVDKSDNISQMRAVLVLGGYVLFSFNLTAYKTFLDDFETSLSKMDQLNVENDNINFSDFSVVNINIEVEQGKYAGHFVYNIEDFEKYMKSIHKLHEHVIKHCNKLIKHFEDLGKRWKFKRNGDTKTTVTNNISEAIKVLNKVLNKINKTRQWYTQDESRIRQMIKNERDAVTTLPDIPDGEENKQS